MWDLIYFIVYRDCTLSTKQEAGEDRKTFRCLVCTKRANLDRSAYLERNYLKPKKDANEDYVQTEFHTKDEIIKLLNARCCVRGCKRGYSWRSDDGRIRGCDLDGLCRVCKPLRDKGTDLPRKEFPVIPYHGRTAAGCTAAFEYQEDLDNYLKITR